MEFRWNHRMDNKCSCCTQVKSNFYIFQYLLSSLLNVCISGRFTKLTFAHFLIGPLIYCKLNLDLLSPIRSFTYLLKAINLIFCFRQPMRFRIFWLFDFYGILIWFSIGWVLLDTSTMVQITSIIRKVQITSL